MSFSPDGKTIVSGSGRINSIYNNTIKLWNASTGKELETRSHSSGVTSISFSPDGKRIVSGLAGHAGNLWYVDIAAILSLACEDLKIQMDHWLTLKEQSPFLIPRYLIKKK